MKVALSVWNERISPVFDAARQILLVDIENGEIVDRKIKSLPGSDLYSQVESVRLLQPDVVICGAISRPLAELLTATGIRIIPFTAGSVEEAISAFLKGKLPCRSLSMPGCCGRMRRFRCGNAKRRLH